jgi:hypothetical protein
MEIVMVEINQDHDIVTIHVVDIDDDAHHLIVENLQGNFLIEIKDLVFFNILFFFLISEIEVVMGIAVENAIVHGRPTIINQVQNDIVHLQRMINVLVYIHIKMEIVKNIDYYTI